MADSASMLMLSPSADPDTPTLIPDNSYDALLCCAGFFQVTPAHFETDRKSENYPSTWNSPIWIWSGRITVDCCLARPVELCCRASSRREPSPSCCGSRGRAASSLGTCKSTRLQPNCKLRQTHFPSYSVLAPRATNTTGRTTSSTSRS